MPWSNQLIKSYMPSTFFQLTMFMWMISITACMTTNFIYLWILMEMSAFLFFIILSLSKFPSFKTMTFFIFQSFSSIIILWLFMNNSELNFTKITFLLMMALKLGLFPFMFWPPLLTKNLPWMLIFMFTTLQKFVPMLMLKNFFLNYYKYSLMSIFLMCIFTILISTIMAIYCNNMKMMMALSSINNTSWMILLILTDYYSFLIYFIFYTTITYLFCKTLIILKLNNFNDLTFLTYSPSQKKAMMMIILILFIMSMIPPFSSFIIKLNATWIFLHSNALSLTLTLMLISTLSIMMYMNMMLKSLMFLFIERKFSFKINMTINKIKHYYMMCFIFLTLTILLMLTALF